MDAMRALQSQTPIIASIVDQEHQNCEHQNCEYGRCNSLTGNLLYPLQTATLYDIDPYNCPNVLTNLLHLCENLGTVQKCSIPLNHFLGS